MNQLNVEDRAHDGLLLNAYDIYVSTYKESSTKYLSLLAVLIARFGSREVLKMINSVKSDKLLWELLSILKLINKLTREVASACWN
ncbi:hypothetical protein Plhal304r1_c054g0139251 [Plasmopara halstedii]